MDNTKQSFASHALVLGSIALITFLLLAGVSDAVPSEEWIKTFGGAGEDVVHYVQQTSDGGYVLAGGTTSYGAGRDDVWLIKTDGYGNEQWNRTFGGVSHDRAYSAQQTSDGGYILAGDTTPYGASWEDVWLIKTDVNGIEQWNRTFGESMYEAAYSVQQTSDEGYILVGYTRYDAWLIKTDTNGNEEWNRTFGGSMYETAYSVQQTSDEGYILAGYNRSYGASNHDAWLIKTDANGNEQWNRTFGGNDSEAAYSVQQTSDDGYILVVDSSIGKSLGPPKPDSRVTNAVWLIKTDANGNEEWKKTFGGVYEVDEKGNFIGDTIHIREGSTVQQTSEGGYIFAAFKQVGHLEDKQSDVLLIKMEGEEKPIETSTPGGHLENKQSDVLLIKNESEEKPIGTSTPGFKIFAAMCSVGVVAVMFILRRKMV